MQKHIILSVVLAALAPAAALAQDPAGILRLSTKDQDPLPGSTILASSGLESPARPSLPRDLEEALPESAVTLRGAELNLLQEEFTPRLRFGLSIEARLDVPGDTSVDSNDNIAYSDIFDVGYGISVEANLMSFLTPHWAIGGYLSVGYDRFSGASNVDMGTGEFFTFGDQDVVTVIVGGKILQKIAPFWFWEGRMGVGLVHYGSLDFTDVTTPIAVSGLQFFKTANRGLFDIAGRIGVGTPRVTFDLGLDFRFMGGEARGRDVSNIVDPDLFFVFALDLGLSLRF
jgi:hypothetical protein